MSHTYHKAEQIVLGYKVLSLCHEAQGCIPQRGDGVRQLDCCNCESILDAPLLQIASWDATGHSACSLAKTKNLKHGYTSYAC